MQHQGVNSRKSAILSSMPVTDSNQANIFLDRQTLDQFLLSCQQTSIKKEQTTIASISLPIQHLDPLTVMNAIAKPNQFNFYWEKVAQGEAICAIDSVMYLQIEGHQRFQLAQDFICSGFERMMTIGALNYL